MMMQDETIDIEVALLQEREAQIRQLEVQTNLSVFSPLLLGESCLQRTLWLSFGDYAFWLIT